MPVVVASTNSACSVLAALLFCPRGLEMRHLSNIDEVFSTFLLLFRGTHCRMPSLALISRKPPTLVVSHRPACVASGVG